MSATSHGQTDPDLAAISRARPGESCESTLVSTRMVFEEPPEKVWTALMFYEQIVEPPPLLLRRLLPIPVRTEGRKSEVGDEVLCVYDSGQLVKRVTEIDRLRRYGFEVVEQRLVLRGGVKPIRGAYILKALANHKTSVQVETRYTSATWPQWFWKPVLAMVCHSFHRFILASMRRSLEPDSRLKNHGPCSCKSF